MMCNRILICFILLRLQNPSSNNNILRTTFRHADIPDTTSLTRLGYTRAFGLYATV